MNYLLNIVYGNYNIILSKLLKKYKQYSMCYNLDKTSIMYEILTKEYCKFIKCYMNYDVENSNYNTENEEFIVLKMSSCMKKKEEKKRYKNLTITIPVYVPYEFNNRRKSKKFNYTNIIYPTVEHMSII